MSGLAHAFRSLRRSPGYAAVVVLTLALGIGANAAIFSLVHGILLEPLPYRDGDELMVLRQHAEETGPLSVSIAEFFDYRDQTESIDLVEYHSMSFTLLGRAEPERVSTGVVSHDFFDVLGVRPAHGRAFAATDERIGAEAVLMLSYEYFQRAFGGDAAVVGRVFEMNDQPHTVIGVLPPIPQYPNQHDVYMPTSACPFRAFGQQRMHEDRDAFRSLTVFGRLAPDADAERADLEVRTIAQRFAALHDETYGRVTDFAAGTAPLGEALVEGARPMLLLLLATTGLVLLLACTNIANLSLARFQARRRDLAIRAALGADGWRLARQGVLEALILSLAGGAFGVLLASASLGALDKLAARLSPRAATIELDGTVLAFALILAVATGLAFGAAPILSRRRSLVTALRDGGHGSTRGKARIRMLLVTLQVAVSAVLLVGAGLLLRSFDRLHRIDMGFDAENVVTAQVALNWSKYTTPEQGRDFYARVLRQLDGDPSIASAAVGSVAPLTQQGARSQNVQVEGRIVEPGQPAPALDLHFVSAGYFETLAIPLRRGRFFDTRDQADAVPVALINASTARRLWPSDDPIGRRLSFDDGASWVEVVGVVGDVRQYALDRAAAEELYRPLAQTGFSNRIVVRSRSDLATVARAIRSAVYAVDPEQPVHAVEPLAATRRDALATERTATWLLAAFAVLALVVTAAGVAGVIAWSVGQRIPEIGVRIALGARRRDILQMVLRQGAGMLVAGLVVGLVGAVFFARLLADLLYETETFDLTTLAAVALVLLGVGLLACLPPARRAMRVDPNVAIRAD